MNTIPYSLPGPKIILITLLDFFSFLSSIWKSDLYVNIESNYTFFSMYFASRYEKYFKSRLRFNVTCQVHVISILNSWAGVDNHIYTTDMSIYDIMCSITHSRKVE